MDNSNKGYALEGDVIVIERELTDLDLFVKKFLDVLIRYSDYLVVSGFVSISTGRTRGTEDVDVIVPIISLEKFKELFSSLNQDGFWCYQGDSAEDCHDYIKDLSSIRFALKDKMFPNIELIPFNASKKAKQFEFTHPQKIRINDFEFKIPPIEFEISYKELVLTGKKDLEDAKHLRTFLADIIKTEKFKEYLPIIKSELR